MGYCQPGRVAMRPTVFFILPILASVVAWTDSVFAESTTIECSSRKHRPEICRVDNTVTAKLIRQRSVVDCIKGKTWGYDRDGVWVRNGCRGRFQVEFGEKRGSDKRWKKLAARDIYCASPKGQYAHCKVNIHGKVRLIHQFSGRNCTRGRSWGVDDRGVWVNRGCSAIFRVADRGARATRREYFGCSSEEFSLVRCEILLPSTISFGQQLSRTQCVKGKTWGEDDRGVWVKGGCSARFIADVSIDEPPPWLVGHFKGANQWGEAVTLHIRRNGLVRARVDDQTVHAELEGDLLLLDGLSYALEKRYEGFKAESTLAGKYAAIPFSRSRY